MDHPLKPFEAVGSTRQDLSDEILAQAYLTEVSSFPNQLLKTYILLSPAGISPKVS